MKIDIDWNNIVSTRPGWAGFWWKLWRFFGFAFFVGSTCAWLDIKCHLTTVATTVMIVSVPIYVLLLEPWMLTRYDRKRQS